MRLSKESLILVFSLILLVVFEPPANAQVTVKSHKINRELSFTYDNDNYFGTDQYYSSGAKINYSRHVESDTKFYKKFHSKKTDSTKLIIRYTYGHQMITPSDIKLRPEQLLSMDRPYAGWHYASFSIDNYPSNKAKNSYKITLGLIGEESGIGNLHEWWHKSFGIKHPRGWDTEIRTEPIINLQYNRLQSFKIYNGMNVVTNSHVQTGNGANKIGQSATIRWGKSNTIDNSSFANSRLSNKMPQIDNNDPQEEEGFIFYGWDASYVLNNVLIQGSLFNDQSPYVKDIEQLVYIRKFGFMYSNYYTTAAFTIYKISREVIGGKPHHFVSLQLTFRY